MSRDAILDALASVRVEAASVRDWQVHGTESRQLSLGIKDREAGNVHAPLSLSESCSTRFLLVWSDGKISRGVVERRQSPHEAFAESRASAYDDPDAAHVLGPAEFPDVELFDDETAAIAGGATELLARRLAYVREAVAHPAARTWSGSFSAGSSDSRLRTSAGLDVASRGTSFGWFVNVNGEAGDGFGARRPESDDAFHARVEALMRTTESLQTEGEPPPAGERSVLLHPRVVRSYVLGTLLDNLDGQAVAHGESAFEAERFGAERPTLRADLELSIDPLLPFRSGSYRFTGFGLPAAPCRFVEGGRLVQPILDVKYARRMGREPTPIPFGHDTVRFTAGAPLALDDALARADVLVLSVLGVHTQDRVSGDFSLSAPLALALSAGALAGRLRGTISGNLWETLRSDVPRFVEFPLETTPGLLFPCRFDGS